MPVLTGAEIWRDYDTDGVPSSGARKISKSDMRAWMLDKETKIASASRTKLAANSFPIYVRADGNDANSGLVDSPSGAFRQIQPAYTLLRRSYDLGGYQPIIHVGAGAFDGGIVAAHAWPGMNYPQLVGEGDTTIIRATKNFQPLFHFTDHAVCGIDNVKLENGGFSNVTGLLASQGGIGDFDRVNAGSMTVPLGVLNNGWLNQVGPCRLSGGAVAALQMLGKGSRINIFPGLTITVTDATNNGAGAVRLTVAPLDAETTGTFYMRTNYPLIVAGVGGVTGANGTFLATVIDDTHVDLQGSTFSGTYTSGGTAKIVSLVIDGTPAFTTFAQALYGGQANASLPPFFSGSATGQRFYFDKRSVDSTGLAATDWPGNTAGFDGVFSFRAFASSAASNATGDGTVVTVTFDTEVYDHGSVFSGSTYTAGGTGRHTLNGAVVLSGLGSGHTTALLEIVTSNRVYRVWQGNPYALSSSGVACLPFSIDADMEAGDSATVRVTVSGSTKTVGIYGAAGPDQFTAFAGHQLN